MEKSSIFSKIEIYGTDIHSEHNLGCWKNNPVCVDSVPLGNFLWKKSSILALSESLWPMDHLALAKYLKLILFIYFN